MRAETQAHVEAIRKSLTLLAQRMDWETPPHRLEEFNAMIEDGDLWYYRPDCSASNLALENELTFSPAFRGPICVEQPWSAVYEAPIVGPLAPTSIHVLHMPPVSP